ncbi:hypothetical protein PGTUg99_035890 [Puccinia graminis f. sp. tritici]|uniref:Uncharacterized protein n=1 Tax=Puccinia graminis f. sp. tritici TaxID=56615 RepID=A0A5B0P4N7_PUCGR|nr:hypothetical protein PGTUg99_035890 [Puccinia graminis f. sp. tritici]
MNLDRFQFTLTQNGYTVVHYEGGPTSKSIRGIQSFQMTRWFPHHYFMEKINPELLEIEKKFLEIVIVYNQTDND